MTATTSLYFPASTQALIDSAQAERRDLDSAEWDAIFSFYANESKGLLTFIMWDKTRPRSITQPNPLTVQ